MSVREAVSFTDARKARADVSTGLAIVGLVGKIATFQTGA